MKKKKQKLSSIISRALIWTAVFSVIVSLAVSTGVLVKNAYDETTVLLKENVADISRDVSDKFMDSINASVVRLEDILWKDISYLRRCSEQSATQYLQMLLSYDFYSMISISDADGIIICSSEPEMIGFDINSSDRSRGFMDLLRNENVISVEPRRSINDPELLRAYAGAAFPDRSGMVLIAVDISAFENMLESELPGSIRNRRVGDSGFMMVCNPEDLNVVSDSRSRYVGRSLVEYRDNIEKSLMNETVFFMMLDDEPEIAYVESVYDYYVIGVYPVFSALSAFKTASLIIILTEAALFPIVFIVVFLILRRRVVKQVENVSSALKRIASGELEGDVNVRDSVEFDTLSDSINTTVSHLKELTSKEKSRYEDELRFANSVRQSSLPSIFP
nr:HAMP domain-containing protein [Lachnospiraceae bacterium]